MEPESWANRVWLQGLQVWGTFFLCFLTRRALADKPKSWLHLLKCAASDFESPRLWRNACLRSLTRKAHRHNLPSLKTSSILLLSFGMRTRQQTRQYGVEPGLIREELREQA
ncbi:hypothetical protein BT63DRAFT_145757 [Microthyrium microscopicum]|uniref:Uncharacterized protein n=1 Tax=Microthyrium microscopicum TaxID=703497 RepID=A0A6A6UNP0_9PEZI|nr:hypothetical protein BT63DRAFT_145757 [Microthyrium microscopicum]